MPDAMAFIVQWIALLVHRQWPDARSVVSHAPVLSLVEGRPTHAKRASTSSAQGR